MATNLEKKHTDKRKKDYNQDEKAVVISQVSVHFRKYDKRPTTLKESIISRFRNPTKSFYSNFEALSNVSFSVKRGSAFSIIGSNGAGKSTLLRILAGILKPTIGKVEIAGSLDCLIQLGAGFDPELNAIENIYLNGSLHKQNHKEMKKRVEPILEFAELKDFAYTPIKYYSSGMSARLGFSVAMDRRPEVLVVDEVLAVGDDRFQQKCIKCFEDFLALGNTLIHVTHNLNWVKDFSSEALLLGNGRVLFQGDPTLAIDYYNSAEYETRLKKPD